MVTAEISFVDVPDGLPVAGVEVEARLDAVGRWTPVSVPDPPRPPGTPLRPFAGRNSPQIMLRGGPPLASQLMRVVIGTVTATSTNDGKVRVSWPAAGVKAVLDKVRSDIAKVDPAAAEKVTAEVIIRAQVEGRDQRFTLHQRAETETTDIVERVGYDFAYSCVGHTTATDTRIWFALVADPVAGAQYSVRVFPPGFLRRNATPVADVAAALTGRTAIVAVAGLAAGFDYRYQVVRAGGAPGGERVLARGTFRTLDPASTQLRLAFASCHHFGDHERLRALSSQPRDALFLMGDQIYGDRTAKEFGLNRLPFLTNLRSNTAADAERMYEAAYTRLWRFPAFRDCLRRGPVYMMLDDHDIADDWGTTFTADHEPALVAGALAAYERWQHAHNPPTATGRYHYEVSFGDVAVFVLDARSQRGRTRDHPVLGPGQAGDFARWATTTAAAADIAVVVSPVPLAFAPTETVQEIIDAVREVGRGVASTAGAAAGWSFGGALGAGFGYWLGGEVWDMFDDAALEEIADAFGVDLEFYKELVVEPDIADQWVNGDNSTDLSFVLDHIFNLANDTAGGGARPVGVILLSGDLHLGMVHEIRSNDPAHAAWPSIIQFTSSPVSHAPSPADLAKALKLAGCLSTNLDFPEPYEARMMFVPPALSETNFGMLTITRTDPLRRSYRIEGQIRGKSSSMPHDWMIELDGRASTAPLPQPPRRR